MERGGQMENVSSTYIQYCVQDRQLKGSMAERAQSGPLWWPRWLDGGRGGRCQREGVFLPMCNYGWFALLYGGNQYTGVKKLKNKNQEKKKKDMQEIMGVSTGMSRLVLEPGRQASCLPRVLPCWLWDDAVTASDVFPCPEPLVPTIPGTPWLLSPTASLPCLLGEGRAIKLVLNLAWTKCTI